MYKYWIFCLHPDLHTRPSLVSITFSTLPDIYRFLWSKWLVMIASNWKWDWGTSFPCLWWSAGRQSFIYLFQAWSGRNQTCFQLHLLVSLMCDSFPVLKLIDSILNQSQVWVSKSLGSLECSVWYDSIFHSTEYLLKPIIVQDLFWWLSKRTFLVVQICCP